MIYENRMGIFQMFCHQLIRATSFSELQTSNTFINEFKTNSRLVKVIGIITIKLILNFRIYGHFNHI